MKKVLVFLLCLSSTMLFAQTLHYQIDNSGCKPQKTTVTGVFMVDGVEIYNGEGMQNQGGQNIEIGVFDQDGNCRGTKFPTWRGTTNAGVVFNKYIYQLQIWGTDGMYYPTFKVYDHNNNMELDLVLDIDETIVWTSGGKYGGIALDQLYAINFTHNAAGGYDLTLTPYNGTNDHYYLISSPVTVNPSAVTNMIEPYAYDLYYFNQEGDGNGNQWITYKDTEGATDPGFGLVPGTGYLYANAGDGEMQTVTLTFPAGTEYEGDGHFELELAQGDWAGWNLVGNPYLETATIDHELFYVINENGTEIMTAEENTIAPMQGVFVKATAEQQDVNFTPANTGSKTPKLSLNLVSNSNVIDRAIVNFGEGSLPKFQINRNSTKLYIPRNGEDYAVVNSEEMGEMPVSFKAQSNGTYSLNLSAKNVNFSYLHLIDNLTGANQDLLVNPSYSFEARTSDYANRFRLVFATANDEDNFAFFSNGSLVINNEGNATLQVVDVTGRIIKCETINGCANVNIDAASGVYMVRLINGDNVKVQKVVK